MTGHLLGDVLQLFDPLTEVCDPLDDCQARGNCVPSPAPGNDAFGGRGGEWRGMAAREEEEEGREREERRVGKWVRKREK